MLYDPKWKEQIAAPDLNEPWRVSLRKAAQTLQRRGWVQGTLQDTKGRLCMIGALVGQGEYGRARVNLEKALGMPAPHWNDMPGRTKKDVIAKFLEVANS